MDQHFDEPAPSHGGSTAGETYTCPFCAAEVLKGGLPGHLTGDCPEA